MEFADLDIPSFDDISTLDVCSYVADLGDEGDIPFADVDMLQPADIEERYAGQRRAAARGKGSVRRPLVV